MSKRKKSAAKPAAAHRRAEGAPDGSSAHIARPPGRVWVFRIVAAVLLPLVLLAAIEVGFRIAGYGHSPRFFRALQLGGKEMLVENDKFGLTFFPPEVARSPAPISMPAKKAQGTYRIFVLGESAALGDPRPAYGAFRYLQVLLQRRYPEQKFEVVCTGVTAINSHAVLPIARECAEEGGDLWIVYMGNNEMVGPFGAATVFGLRAPPLWYVRLTVGLQKFRLGQWLIATGRKLRKSDKSDTAWGGMEMFLNSRIKPDDPRRQTVHAHFRRNLEDILRVGRNSGAKVVLSTVAVNLKDCAPFASLESTNALLSGGERFTELLASGARAQAEGRVADAKRLLEQALSANTGFAETEFRLGTVALASTNTPAARQHLEAARDKDALPFRTDSQMNEAIKGVAAAYQKDAGFRFFDAQDLFSGQSEGGIAGAEFFYEHVHFNFEGNYLLGRAWAEQVESLLPASIANGRKGDWASQAECDRQLALTAWNRYSVYDDMIARLKQPPFTGQINHTNQLARLRQELQAAKKAASAEAAAEAGQIYVEALKSAPGDFRLHENYAEFLELRGNLAAAAEEWDQVRELLPHHHVAYFHVGQLARKLGRLDQARAMLNRAVALRPDLAEGWLELGQVEALGEKHAQALAYFDRELRLVPGDSRAYLFKGRSLAKLERHDAAIATLREALRLRPDYWEAHYFLGEELAFSGKTAEARKHFEEVVRLRPEFPMAHLNLGVALFQSGELEAAAAQFQETLRLDANNALAAKYLQQLKARKP